MKFNRILLIVVSLAFMLFALAGCGKDSAEEIKRRCHYDDVNGFSKRNWR